MPNTERRRNRRRGENETRGGEIRLDKMRAEDRMRGEEKKEMIKLPWELLSDTMQTERERVR